MTKKTASPSKPVNPQGAARMQSATARGLNGKVPQGHYVGRIQRAAVKNQPQNFVN